MAEVIVTVSWELLLTAVIKVAPWKTTTEEETNWLPVRVREKLGGNWANTIVFGEIEVRIGTGRALPQRGFKALHPGRNNSRASRELRRPIRWDEDIVDSSVECMGFRDECWGK
jgi:hypothetical protein